MPVTALKLEGDRVVVEQHVRGQAAAEALPGMLEQIVRGIPFRKSMRWDALETEKFARPVHWIAAALDGKPLAVKFADVQSAPRTRGHRFAAPQEFPLPSAKEYVPALRKAHVLVDWAERSKRISEEVARAAAGESLADRSSRPQHSPHATPPALVLRIRVLRQQRRTCGVIAAQVGQPGVAIDLIGRAIRFDPAAAPVLGDR